MNDYFPAVWSTGFWTQSIVRYSKEHEEHNVSKNVVLYGVL
jgi:hypothetical protein